ncbi:MAG: hypothetical protein ACE5F1_02600 [Planctomycetota bacterium]
MKRPHGRDTQAKQIDLPALERHAWPKSFDGIHCFLRPSRREVVPDKLSELLVCPLVERSKLQEAYPQGDLQGPDEARRIREQVEENPRPVLRGFLLQSLTHTPEIPLQSGDPACKIQPGPSLHDPRSRRGHMLTIRLEGRHTIAQLAHDCQRVERRGRLVDADLWLPRKQLDRSKLPGTRQEQNGGRERCTQENRQKTPHVSILARWHTLI